MKSGCYPRRFRKKIACLVVFVLFIVYNTFWRKGSNTFNQTGRFYDNLNRNFHDNEQFLPSKNKLEIYNVIKPLNKTTATVIQLPPTVLIFTYSKNYVSRSLKFVLNSLKISYEVLTWSQIDRNMFSFPRMEDSSGRTRYHTFIFHDQHLFETLDEWSRKIIYNHCKKFEIGIVIIFGVSKMIGESEFYQMKSIPVSLKFGEMELTNFEVVDSELLRITRSGKMPHIDITHKQHVVFATRDPSFKGVVYSMKKRFASENKVITLIHDTGIYDGVQKVLFDTSLLSSWLYRLLLIDALMTLSRNYLGYGLDRYIQIDIDDVFVGKRLNFADIEALIQSQRYLSTHIDKFRYYLGFSGSSYQNSSDEAVIQGEEYLLRNSKSFHWFCHLFSHKKAHTLSEKRLMEQLNDNKQFAEAHDIAVDPSYAVAPYHSGVYPVHRALYNTWKRVWGIKVTTTEGYPSLYPAWNRHGFIFNDIKVLPRQTCGLFTKTLHLEDYPRGPHWLQNSAEGGELFWTVVTNPISIFMTHAVNYAMQDRLAIPLFKNLTLFIKKWTNLRLLSRHPTDLAKRYFKMFPKEEEPLWTDPCTDFRHQKIWNATADYCAINKTRPMSQLPDFLIIGPQKTGTTALYSFLDLQPALKHSRPTEENFEEVQFFSNKHDYTMKGLEWYLKLFPNTPKPKGTLYYEKSASYFDNSKSPMRLYSLIPNAKLVVVAIDPIYRAYSWYQHILSKDDPIARSHSFYEVITGKNRTNDERFFTLMRKCLEPGNYANILLRWMQYYSPSKIHIVDGEELRSKPFAPLHKLQRFLGLPPFPYEKRIAWSERKGFYCPLTKDYKFDCLGGGKGRGYGQMSEESLRFLTEYYREANVHFARLLARTNKTLPKWLKRQWTDSTLNYL